MTLADLSAWIRAALKWVAAGVGILILLWIAWIVIAGISSSIFKPRGADTQFGVIDPPLFVKTYSVFNAGKLENGVELPESNQKLNVYKFEKNSKFSEDVQKKIISFFSLPSAERIEDKGLITIRRKTDETVLKINTSSSHFTYRKSVSERIVDSKVGLNESTAQEKANEAFDELGLNLDNANINTGEPVITYWKVTSDAKVSSNAESANAIEIEFFRNVDQSVSTGDAPVRIMYANGGRAILEFDFYFSPVDEVGAAYPIISASEALELLKNGGGYTATNQPFDSAKITSIILGYWESKFFQAYFQPVWKFTGKGMVGGTETSFEAFVPAVSTTYLAVPQEEQPSAPAPPTGQ